MEGFVDAGTKTKEEEKTQKKNEKGVKALVICFRVAALGTSMAAASLTFTCNESTLIFGIPMDAKYSYSPAFKFFAIANAIGSLFALISFCLTFFVHRFGSHPDYYFMFLFLHDLVIMSLLLAGCAAATAIGYVGQKGNIHAGWMPICDHFHRFCHRSTTAVLLGYLSFIIFFFLTIFSARQIHRVQPF